PDSSLKTVFVVTDRAPDGPGQIGYGNDRAGLSYEAMTISVPPGHHPGHVEWTSARASDPAINFVVVDRTRLDEEEFARRIAARTSGDGLAGVFVHGYNNSLQKAIFRTAQLAADAEHIAAPILFSWPS